MLDGLCNALGKDEKLFYDNNCLHTDNIKLNIDTAYYLEDESGKNKIGAKAENYPDLEKVINIKLPFHFTLDNINNLQARKSMLELMMSKEQLEKRLNNNYKSLIIWR